MKPFPAKAAAVWERGRGWVVSKSVLSLPEINSSTDLGISPQYLCRERESESSGRAGRRRPRFPRLVPLAKPADRRSQDASPWLE